MLTSLECINQLCGIVQKLVGIVSEQSAVIENSLEIDAFVKDRLREKRNKVDDEIDLLELRLRPHCSPVTCKFAFDDHEFEIPDSEGAGQ